MYGLVFLLHGDLCSIISFLNVTGLMHRYKIVPQDSSYQSDL